MNLVLLVLALFFSGYALGQEALVADAAPATESLLPIGGLDLPKCLVDATGLTDVSHLPELVLKALPIFLVVLLLLRVLSAGLLMIAEKTETKADDKVAQAIATAASLMARGLSIVASISMPKALLMAKAEKIAIGELKSDKSKATDVPPVG